MGHDALDLAGLAVHRTVTIQGALGEDATTQIIAQLLFLEAEDPKAPVHVRIDSDGGSVVHWLPSAMPSTPSGPPCARTAHARRSEWLSSSSRTGPGGAARRRVALA
jgi:hypothetical protein